MKHVLSKNGNLEKHLHEVEIFKSSIEQFSMLEFIIEFLEHTKIK